MKIRFIIVDDAAFLREIIKNIVTSVGGICVGEAEDGEQALSLLSTTLPDVVFLDMVMPGKNGIETAKEIKSQYPEIKIIGCSTIDNEALIRQAYEAGFDAYILKPFNKDQILNEIANVLPHLKESIHGRT